MADAPDHGNDKGGHAGHDHTAGANAKSLAIALGLTGSFLIAELVGAWWFNSLALLSDAAHIGRARSACLVGCGRRRQPDCSCRDRNRTGSDGCSQGGCRTARNTVRDTSLDVANRNRTVR